jgi:hypothetical protein
LIDQQGHHGVKTQAIDRGYRQTAQRAMVLTEVKAAEGHPTAGEIFARVRRKDPKVAYGTVYRSLHLLARHGLIQELTFADQASRYDGRVDRHDHDVGVARPRLQHQRRVGRVLGQGADDALWVVREVCGLVEAMPQGPVYVLVSPGFGAMVPDSKDWRKGYICAPAAAVSRATTVDGVAS